MNDKITYLGPLLTILLATSGAVAADPEAAAGFSRSANVSLAGLDLSTPDGLDQARERVHQTARRLCLQVEDNYDLSHQQNYVRCIDDSMSIAMQQISKSAAHLAKAKNDRPPQS